MDIMKTQFTFETNRNTINTHILLSKTQQLLSTELVIYPPHCHETLETNMAKNGLIEKSKSEN